MRIAFGEHSMSRSFLRWTISLVLLMVSFRLGAAPLMPGQGEGGMGTNQGLVQKVQIRLPGVYYLWVRVSSASAQPETISYDLDGKQVLSGDKTLLVVPPYAKALWLAYTVHPRFKAQLYAGSGPHLLAVWQEGGKAGALRIENALLTLSNSAFPSGNGLDESMDLTADKWSPQRHGSQALVLESHGTPDPEGGESKAGVMVTRGRTFFVSTLLGNDKANGRSPKRAWKTFGPVNRQTFKPGDSILLARGEAWEGTLAPRGQGKTGHPVLIGAYGKGRRPRINGLAGPGVLLKDQSHWVIQDLCVTNFSGSRADGIQAIGSKASASQPSDLTIRRCQVEDAGGAGIHVGNLKDGAKDGLGQGYDTVTVEDCLVRWCDNTGVLVHGKTQDGCRNTVIRHCAVYGNGGHGIWIHSGENGLISDSVAFNNGWKTDGTVGIWCWNARNIRIARCEAYRTLYFDGAGFDIDWGCMGCLVEGCYAHDNDGEGYLIMGSGTADFYGFSTRSAYNVLRYCVAETNGLRGGEDTGIVATETFEDSWVYNNTSISRPALKKASKSGKTGAALFANGWEYNKGWGEGPGKFSDGGWPARVRFANNVFLGLGQALAVDLDAGMVKGKSLFDHNLYAASGKLLGRWGSQEFDSIKALRSLSGQESGGIEGRGTISEGLDGRPGRIALDRLRPPAASQASKSGAQVILTESWRKARLEKLGKAPSRPELSLDLAEPLEDASGKALNPGEPRFMGALKP